MDREEALSAGRIADLVIMLVIPAGLSRDVWLQDRLGVSDGRP